MPNGVSTESLLHLTRDLVRIPSRGGIDSYGPVFERISEWLGDKGISAELVLHDSIPVAATATLGDPRKGPTYLLIATADTAEFGDESNWTTPALSGEIRDGWLYGRGSSDSKAGISVFCHVAATLLPEADRMRGAITLVFDAEEHSGTFLGIERFLASLSVEQKIAGAMIGYPGQEKIVIGCRGFYRVAIRVHGRAAHSGSSSSHGINAIVRAAALAQRLQHTELPPASTPEFPLRPQLTVTAVKGGNGDSIVPDLCVVHVDIRLTPAFNSGCAERLIQSAVTWLDEQKPSVACTEVEVKPAWPAYVLPRDNRMVQALWESARRVLGRELERAVAGPSSVGNLLAVRGIPATAGFGVINRNTHAADECILIDSLVPAYDTYLGAVHELLRG